MGDVNRNYNVHEREVGTRHEDSMEFDVKNWFSQDLFDDIVAELEKTNVFELDDDVPSHKLITQVTEQFREFLVTEFESRVRSTLIDHITFAGRSAGWLCVMVPKVYEDELPKSYEKLYNRCEAIIKKMKAEQRQLWKKFVDAHKISANSYTETHYFVAIEPK